MLQNRSHYLDQRFDVSLCNAQLAVLLLHGVLEILMLTFEFLDLSLIVDRGRPELLCLLFALLSYCLKIVIVFPYLPSGLLEVLVSLPLRTEVLLEQHLFLALFFAACSRFVDQQSLAVLFGWATYCR